MSITISSSPLHLLLLPSDQLHSIFRIFPSLHLPGHVLGNFQKSVQKLRLHLLKHLQLQDLLPLKSNLIRNLIGHLLRDPSILTFSPDSGGHIGHLAFFPHQLSVQLHPGALRQPGGELDPLSPGRLKDHIFPSEEAVHPAPSLKIHLQNSTLQHVLGKHHNARSLQEVPGQSTR